MDIIYLRVYNLTKKQEREILNKGRLRLRVKFSLVEVGESKRGDKFLHFVVTGLGKKENFSTKPPPKDL